MAEEEERLNAEEEIYIEEECIEDVFFAEGEFSGEGFSDGEAAFSDGGNSFTDTEETSFEKNSGSNRGRGYYRKLNAALLGMKEGDGYPDV